MPLIFTQKRKRCDVKKANFNAGPGLLPESLEQQLNEARKDFMGRGLSVISISHRDKAVIPMVEETVALVREVLNVPSNHVIVFPQGGASMQFKAWYYNLVPFPTDHKPSIGYLDTGTWSDAAVAKRGGADLQKAGLCSVFTFESTREYKYRRMRHDWYNSVAIRHHKADFIHITTNETTNGTQLRLDGIPQRRKYEIVADMSSDILSQPIAVDKYAYIYAGFQKNCGKVGASLVIACEDLIQDECPLCPGPLIVAEQVKAHGALFNTADIEAIYSFNLMLKWIKEKGGLPEMHRRSKDRAALLYEAIDTSDVFVGIAEEDSRSLMNIAFQIEDSDRHDAFQKFCKESGIEGLDGHRNTAKVIGRYFRAANYNAQTMENMRLLVDVMAEFERRS
jgi:phosphoserine aminotransferase